MTLILREGTLQGVCPETLKIELGGPGKGERHAASLELDGKFTAGEEGNSRSGCSVSPL